MPEISWKIAEPDKLLEELDRKPISKTNKLRACPKQKKARNGYPFLAKLVTNSR